MRKLAICMCENKSADQLYCNRTADQRLCFRYINSKIPRQNFKPLTSFISCTAWFVSDLVGNPKDRFFCDAGHIGYSFDSIQGIQIVLLILSIVRGAE